MAEAIKISVDKQKLSADLRRLTARYPRATAIALNRTVKRAETLAVREIQADVGASAQKTIRRNLTTRDAKESKLEAAVVAFSAKKDRIPIFEMKPRPRSVTRRKPPVGVSYGNDRKVIPSSFIAIMPSGHQGVFQRVGGKVPLARGKSKGKVRQRITELFGPSVALVFSRQKIQQKLRELVAKVGPDEFARAFKFAR
jgi:hypothetical protein